MPPYGIGLLLLALAGLPLGMVLDRDPAEQQAVTRRELAALPVLAGIREEVRSDLDVLTADPAPSVPQARERHAHVNQQAAAAKTLAHTSALILDPGLQIYHWAYLDTIKLPERLALGSDLAELALEPKPDPAKAAFLRQTLSQAWLEETRALGLALGDASDPVADSIWRQNQVRLQRLGGGPVRRAELRAQVQDDLLFWDLVQQRLDAALRVRDALLTAERRRRLTLVAGIDLLLALAAWLVLQRLRRRALADAAAAAAEAARLGQTSYETLFAAIPLPALAYTIETRRIVEANPACAEMLELPADQLQGMSLDAFIPLEDRPDFVEGIRQRDMTEVFRGQRTVRTAGGRILELNVHSRLVSLRGNALRLVLIEDVTEMRRLQRTLAANEELYRALVENSSDALVLMSREGRVVYASPSTANVIGFTPEERVGSHSNQLLHPDDQPGVWKVFNECIADPSRVYEFQSRIRHKDGRWVRTAAKLRNFLGVPAIGALVLNYHDITAEHDAGEALLRSQAFFKALLEQSRETTMLVGPNMLVEYITPSVEAVIGYAPEERLGQDSRSLLHPEDLESFLALLGGLLQRPGGSRTAEYRLRHKRGAWVMVEAQISNRLQDPAIGALVVTYRDITARKTMESALSENEEYYRALIENGRDIVAIFRPNGTMSYENPRALEPLGYTPADLEAMGPYSLIHPEDLPEALRRLELYRSDPQRIGQLLVRLKAKDGRWLEFEARARNLRDNAVVGGILIQLRDVSEAREAQRHLLRMERLAAIGQTASGLAHEVRNPLAVITTQAEYLRLQLADRPALLPELESIVRQSDRLRDLVQSVLERSRTQEPVYAVGAGSDLMERALRAAQLRFGRASEGVEVLRDYADPPPTLRVDLAQMERVLTNLILNALQAIRGGGAITLCAREAPEGPVLEVSDNGEGIAPEILGRIFEPFFTTKDTGSGLGLWICRSIVEEHGGVLTASNLPPRGCVFRIQLPSTGGAAA